ncbi:c-type cytochrome [Hyphomicrobium sp. xq]|uniref:C-type cytochrome n=1 Tax=Hyphomicrobium album TaxID=2665159 RepID=A0A6I3KU67_9HYPH|nr:c-type cytochrome [Hyphomicrobium album]MTD96221.1 c-type cytochrome [Hyphomicrobium album]
MPPSSARASSILAAVTSGLVLLGSQAFAQTIEEKAQVCSACHGEAGIPQEKTTPVIWGQNEGYLYLQLRDFNKGSRKNEQMSPIAADLSKDDMKALAAYFTKLAWPNLQQPSAAKDVSTKALTAVGSIGCPSCHLDQLQGDGTTARLAGQQSAYLKQTMLAFRDGSRGNNPGMSDLMKAISPEDIDAISQYAAGLQILGGSNGR